MGKAFMNSFNVSIASLMLLASSAVMANGNHPAKPDPSKPVTATADSSSDASSTSSANALSTSSAAGGAGGSIDYFNGGSRSYALFSGGATPLPATTCPKGDSQYFQLLFGVVTWATSTTRTEMECLDKVLAAMRAQPLPALPKLPVADRLHPEPSTTGTNSTKPAAKPLINCI
jgi:hypothetical protein